MDRKLAVNLARTGHALRNVATWGEGVVGRSSVWLLTVATALSALALCVAAAYYLLPWDVGTRMVVGTAAGVVIGAVIAVWGASAADKRSQAAGKLMALLSTYVTDSPHSRLQYEGVRSPDGKLRIWPRDPYLDLVRSGAPLDVQRYGVSLWAHDGFVWPTLDVKIINNSSQTVFFHEARFNVRDSRTDLRPVPIIHWLAGGPYLTLKNLGWGPMEDCSLRFHLEQPEDPSPLTADRFLRLDGDGQPIDSEPLREALAEAGVDLQALGIDGRNRWICHRPPPPELLGPFKSGWAAVIGDLEYTQTEPDGSRTRQRHGFRSLIIFVGAVPGGAAAPATAEYKIRLRPDAKDYQVVAQISHSLGAGETDRFVFAFAAERSSLHDFSVNLLYNDGERLDCGLVALELFVPRDVVRSQAL